MNHPWLGMVTIDKHGTHKNGDFPWGRCVYGIVLTTLSMTTGHGHPTAAFLWPPPHQMFRIANEGFLIVSHCMFFLTSRDYRKMCLLKFREFGIQSHQAARWGEKTRIPTLQGKAWHSTNAQLWEFCLQAHRRSPYGPAWARSEWLFIRLTASQSWVFRAWPAHG